MKLPKLNVEKLKTLNTEQLKDVAGGEGTILQPSDQKSCGVCSLSI